MSKTRQEFNANEHPLRRMLSDELHARKFNNFPGTGRFIRYVYFTQGDDHILLRDINALLDSLSLREMRDDEKFIRLEAESFAVRVERHTEFMSLSLIDIDPAPKTGLSPTVYDEATYPHLPFAQIKQLRHPIFHAMWLEITQSGQELPTSLMMEQALQGRSVAGAHISSNGAQLYASFDIDSCGYSRLALFNDTIADYRMGRVIQRIVELETYRLMALLSLPKVKQFSRELDEIEAELRQATSSLAKAHHQLDSHAQFQDAETLLTQLTKLSSQSEQIYSQTSYRFAASRAYQDIIDARIASLNASRLDGFQSIGGFLAKRMMPALQSMTAFSKRLDHLSGRISSVAQLQRSQTELSLQKQNRDLLTSMNERTFAQLRLQQTVEGLSLAAITYYGVGLVGYIAASVPMGVSPTLIKSLSVPVIALAAYLVIRRARHALDAATDPD